MALNDEQFQSNCDVNAGGRAQFGTKVIKSGQGQRKQNGTVGSAGSSVGFGNVSTGQ